MTTLVVSNGILAIDTGYSLGSSFEHHCAMKLIRTEKGELLAMVGNFTQNLRAIAAYTCGGRLEGNINGGSVFVFHKGEQHHLGPFNDRVIKEPRSLNINTVAGSGARYASSALDHGASAVDAVKYAALRDGCTGGVVISCVIADLPEDFEIPVLQTPLIGYKRSGKMYVKRGIIKSPGKGFSVHSCSVDLI